MPIGVNPSVYRPLRYQYGGDGCYRYLSPAVYDGAFRYLFRYNLFNDERHDLLGIWLPVRKVTRMVPAEALHYE